MSKKIKVRIKSANSSVMYLDYVDPILGVAIPYRGDNPPTFGKMEATKIINWLNQHETNPGYARHYWRIEEL
jgi:hypothetical protein